MKSIITLIVVAFLSAIFLFAPNAYAAIIDHGNLIADHNFDSSSSMSALAIDTWLNTTYGSTSCISTNHGFSSPEPIGYTPTRNYSYGSAVSAGKVIHDASFVFGINPQVLLVMLEKEESLVSGSVGCNSNKYATAVGYGCPDGGSLQSYTYTNGHDIGTLPSPLFFLNNLAVTATTGSVCTSSASKTGFSEQVIHAAWLLKWSKERAEGNVNWNIQLSDYPIPGAIWDNSDDPTTCYSGPMTVGNFKRCQSYAQPVYFDSSLNIDGSNVLLSNGATASLYTYTPHFLGNDNFVKIYTSWFGSPSDYYDENQATVSAFSNNIKGQTVSTDSISANQRYWIVVSFRNNGSTVWSNTGSNPIRLTVQENSPSIFKDASWISDYRVTTMDQSLVGPGNIATFSFWYDAPLVGHVSDTATHFGLVAESLSAVSGSLPIIYTRALPPTYEANEKSITFYRDDTKAVPVNASYVIAGEKIWATVSMRNNGSAMWITSGSSPVRLATDDTSSPFCDIEDTPAWIACSRPASMNEKVVGPGNTATFGFWFRARQTVHLENYSTRFSVISEGNIKMNGSDISATVAIQPQSWTANNPKVSERPSPELIPSTTLTDQMHQGNKLWLTLTFRNNGSSTWLNYGQYAVRLAITNTESSLFKDASWISGDRVASMSEPSVGPGETATFNFWYDAPSVTHSSAFVTQFALVAENLITIYGERPLVYTLVTP